MDPLRLQARRLEHTLDAKLVQFNQHAGAACSASDHADGAQVEEMVADIESLLAQLTQVNDAMRRRAAGEPGVAAAMQTMQRHNDILHDFTQEIAKARANLARADERRQLLSSVRREIADSRSAAARAEAALLRERNAIHGSERAADDVISQAEAAKAALTEQRRTFGSVGAKLANLAKLAPQVQGLIGAISRRRRRDKTILGLVIGVCAGLLVIYAIGG